MSEAVRIQLMKGLEVYQHPKSALPSEDAEMYLLLSLGAEDSMGFCRRWISLTQPHTLDVAVSSNRMCASFFWHRMRNLC